MAEFCLIEGEFAKIRVAQIALFEERLARAAFAQRGLLQEAAIECCAVESALNDGGVGEIDVG